MILTSKRLSSSWYLPSQSLLGTLNWAARVPQIVGGEVPIRWSVYTLIVIFGAQVRCIQPDAATQAELASRLAMGAVHINGWRPGEDTCMLKVRAGRSTTLIFLIERV